MFGLKSVSVLISAHRWLPSHTVYRQNPGCTRAACLISLLRLSARTHFVGAKLAELESTSSVELTYLERNPDTIRV